MKEVTLYFDVISPYVWLAWQKLETLERETGISLEVRPVLFAGLLNQHGNLGPAEIPVKRAYVMRDVMREAAVLGLEMKGPPQHPFNPLVPLRVLTATPGPSRRALAGRLLQLSWGEGEDITREEILKAACRAEGLDGESLLTAAGEPAVKARLRAATEQAAASGVFGVPSFVAGKELFWGADRMDTLAAFLRGECPVDDRKVEEILSRPRAADRPNAPISPR